MSDQRMNRLAWGFVGAAALAGALLFGGLPAGASDDHDKARALRASGDVLPLVELLGRDDLSGLRVLEAELEDRRGRMVYELELLDPAGRVEKRDFDAATGEPLPRDRDD